MITNINVGLTANDGLGDKLRNAFIIVNQNFDEIDAILTGTNSFTISQVQGLQTALTNINNQIVYIPGLQSDINDINNTIYTINQTLNNQNTSIADLYNEITNLQNQIYTKIEEAPIDGVTYGRKDGAWVVVSVTETIDLDGVLANGDTSTDKSINMINGSLSISNGSMNNSLAASLILSNGFDASYTEMTSGSLFLKASSPAGGQFLKADPLQNASFVPQFYLPAKSVTGVYRLATTTDYTLQAVTTLNNTTNAGIQFQPTLNTGTGSKYVTVANNLVYLFSQSEGYSTITNDKIIWSRFGNVVSLSGWGAAGSNTADYILPTKSPATYTLATTADITLNTVTSGNTTMLNITGASARVLYVRGLTSSNQSISITSTGSNTNTNWAWDIKSNITKTSDLINDGDNGTSHFISLEDLPSTLTLYPTTATSSIGGYNRLVTSITDPIYNATAVDITTGAITGTDQLIAGLITEPGLIIGNPGIFNMTTIGNIRKTSGSGQAEFFFRVYKRDVGGTETLILQSSNTPQITSAIYSQFFASALWDDGIFISTDRIVLKFYGTKVGGGSSPTYDFQFGGTNPVRSLVPIPLNVTTFSLTLNQVQRIAFLKI